MGVLLNTILSQGEKKRESRRREQPQSDLGKCLGATTDQGADLLEKGIGDGVTRAGAFLGPLDKS
jgi:hypothetical protein